MYVCISCFVFVVLQVSVSCSATLPAHLHHKAPSPCDETEPYFREQPLVEFLMFKALDDEEKLRVRRI